MRSMKIIPFQSCYLVKMGEVAKGLLEEVLAQIRTRKSHL
jgi:hypothetical protein